MQHWWHTSDFVKSMSRMLFSLWWSTILLHNSLVIVLSKFKLVSCCWHAAASCPSSRPRLHQNRKWLDRKSLTKTMFRLFFRKSFERRPAFFPRKCRMLGPRWRGARSRRRRRSCGWSCSLLEPGKTKILIENMGGFLRDFSIRVNNFRAVLKG